MIWYDNNLLHYENNGLASILASFQIDLMNPCLFVSQQGQLILLPGIMQCSLAICSVYIGEHGKLRLGGRLETNQP